MIAAAPLPRRRRSALAGMAADSTARAYKRMVDQACLEAVEEAINDPEFLATVKEQEHGRSHQYQPAEQALRDARAD